MDVEHRILPNIKLIENLQRKDLTAWEEADGLAALCEKYGYTHDEVARKVGKSRSSVTESLSIAAIPEVIREKCRRADINIKSTLLQIIRQPDDQSMLDMVDEIINQGLTRDEARDLRRKKISQVSDEKPRRPFVLRHQFAEENAQLEIKFRNGEVGRERIIEILKGYLKSLEDGGTASDNDGGVV